MSLNNLSFSIGQDFMTARTFPKHTSFGAWFIQSTEPSINFCCHHLTHWTFQTVCHHSLYTFNSWPITSHSENINKKQSLLKFYSSRIRPNKVKLWFERKEQWCRYNSNPPFFSYIMHAVKKDLVSECVWERVRDVLYFYLRSQLQEREIGWQDQVTNMFEKRGEFSSLVFVDLNRKLVLQNGI